ncbi:39S ribosomal protein L42, mitochondrial-like [Elysia marginata]|uniref:Large ribosomal subunit protein mL42 n=1 Tax=Elysia marginata TaxID=1093978 RepID=A0AAV4JIC2_9GAST|nr:39S ribosomal protein L42, mitochondrial-like [Elysia marginata]
MAAPLNVRRIGLRFVPQLIKLESSLFFTSEAHVLQRQNFSVSCQMNKTKPPDVCLSPDKSMIMCWHPEPEFPYEHTQPLPRDKSELEVGDSVLKIQYLVDEKLKNRPEGPTVNELSGLFYANKEDFKRRVLHSMYTSPPENVIKQHKLNFHMYADDTKSVYRNAP